MDTRVLLIAADDTDQSEHAYKWALDNLYKGEQDELHLVRSNICLHADTCNTSPKSITM